MTAAATITLHAAALAGNVAIDNTLNTGFTGPLTGPNYQLSEAFGKVSGKNLLISLSDLRIDRGESVRFTSGVPLTNVITRVTGGQASSINGLVRSEIAGAQLFIINPRGIVVGPTAVFEVAGGLHLSTAASVGFADGTTLDTRGGDAPTLSSAEPRAFGFLPGAAGIAVRGARFVPAVAGTLGNNLSFTAGDVSLAGVTVVAPGGDVRFAAGGDGQTPIPGDRFGGGKSSLAEGGSIALLADRAGRATQVDVTQAGYFTAAADRVSIRNSTVDASASPGSIGLGINVSARDLDLSAATLQSNASGGGRGLGVGEAGLIALTGVDRLRIRDGTLVQSILTAATPGAPLSGKGIALESADLQITSGGQVLTSTDGGFVGPQIYTQRTGTITIDGGGGDAFTGIAAQTLGKQRDAATGGSIFLNADGVRLLRNAEIRARTLGAGQAGDVTVNAADLTIDGGGFNFTGIESRAGEQSTGGAGGLVTVNLTGDLLLKDGGVITATTLGPGRGGNVEVTARNVIATGRTGNEGGGEFFTGIFARSAFLAEGNDTPQDLLGDAGRVSVTAADRVRVTDGAELEVTSVSLRDGATSGDLIVSAPRVVIDNDGRMLAASERNAGNIQVGPVGTLILRGTGEPVDVTKDRQGTRISTNARGNGGNIRIGAVDVLVVDGEGVINASAGGVGGFFTIAPAGAIVLGNSNLDAVARLDADVRVEIDAAAAFIKSADAQINARAPQLPPDVDLSSALTPFTVTFADVSKRLQADCTQQAGVASSFVVDTAGGLRLGSGG